MRPERWLKKLSFWLRLLLKRREVDRELDDEIEYHIEAKTEENIAKGMTPEEARRAARIELGGVEQAKENVRGVRVGAWLDTLLQDVRYGLRMLRKNPGFTVVAILTISLGIGANTTIFSMVDWLMLRPIPGVKNPDQLAFLVAQFKGGGYDTFFSYPNFEDIRNETDSVFSHVAGVVLFQTEGLNADGKTMQISVDYVTGEFFETLGIKPALGRFILPSEGQVPGADPVLVLSYPCWQVDFGGDPNIVGRKVNVNGQPVTIIGVAPKEFHGPLAVLDTQGYLPVSMASATLAAKADFFVNRKTASQLPLIVIASLKPGLELGASQPVLRGVAERLSRQYPAIDNWLSIRAAKLTAAPPGPDAAPSHPLVVIASLFLFLAGMVLLIACVNVANLQLVRAIGRAREMAVRAALGAARARLIRQMLIESGLLALLGCTGGIVVGVAGAHILGSFNVNITTPVVLDFSFNWRVFAYALAAALVTSVLVGTVPAIRASRCNLSDVLHEGSRTETSGRQRMRTVLVVAQVAGSLMLLIVAGLFVRSLQNVEHRNLGFNPKHVLNISMDPHEAGLDAVKGMQLFNQLLERVRSVPGVESASIAAFVPMGLYSDGAQLKIPGHEPRAGESPIYVGENAVSPGYFETMTIPLIEGRDFLDSDAANAPHVAIVNEAMAKKYWPTGNPIGRDFVAVDDPTHPVKIVGVVRDSVTGDISEMIAPYFYLPFAQKYSAPATLQLRATGAAGPMAGEILGVIRSVGPAMPPFDVQTMAHALDNLNGLMLYQLAASLGAVFGILGLTLAAVGLYGVVSYSASQRTHEIGIRLALGAQPRQVLRMMFRQGLLIVTVGLGVGVLAAIGISRLVGALLFGAGGLDLATYAAVSTILAAVALTACYIPARRAVRVDPMVALRHE